MLCFYAGPLLICMMAWLLLTLLAQTRETSASAVGGFYLEEEPTVKEIDQASCHQDTMIKTLPKAQRTQAWSILTLSNSLTEATTFDHHAQWVRERTHASLALGGSIFEATSN